MGDELHQALEVVVAGDEVRLRVDLDHGGLGALGEDADKALGGDAAGLLGGLRQALLAEKIDGRLDVAVGLVQGRLAVHHACAGHLAQFLDHLGGDVRHGSVLELKVGMGNGRSAGANRPELKNRSLPDTSFVSGR